MDAVITWFSFSAPNHMPQMENKWIKCVVFVFGAMRWPNLPKGEQRRRRRIWWMCVAAWHISVKVYACGGDRDGIAVVAVVYHNIYLRIVSHTMYDLTIKLYTLHNPWASGAAEQATTMSTTKYISFCHFGCAPCITCNATRSVLICTKRNEWADNETMMNYININLN